MHKKVVFLQPHFALIILGAWSHDESAHVQSARADKVSGIALSCVAVGAVCVAWDEDFSRNWLNLQPKIHDSSFSTVNEANYMDKLSLRLRENRQSFNDELHKYEQLCAYKTMRSNGLNIVLA